MHSLTNLKMMLLHLNYLEVCGGYCSELNIMGICPFALTPQFPNPSSK